MGNYDPISDLLNDNSITEIMVNGISRIYVERQGKLQLTEKQFGNEQELYALIDSIVRPLGKRVDVSTPYADARLPDGSRVNIIIPPLSLTGPMVTIRKFSDKKLSGYDLVSFGAMNENMLSFLRLCVESKRNIIISGGTGSGKTTLLNVVSSFIPAGERILTIEDTAELRLDQEHVGRLEARTPDLNGEGAVSIRQLLINALRMRPDRIIIGECRGGEALDMLQAMNTGHNGSLTTLHANTPRDCLKRLEVMVLMAGYDLPVRAIREQIASAISIIVQVSRLQDGSRKVITISEVTGMEGDVITMSTLFEFKGDFKATQTIPAFIQELRAGTIPIDMGIFE